MDWQERISSDPHICHGKPCIVGTRVMVSVVIDNLADGNLHQSIVDGYVIAEKNIEAALRYAADHTTWAGS